MAKGILMKSKYVRAPLKMKREPGDDEMQTECLAVDIRTLDLDIDFSQPAEDVIDEVVRRDAEERTGDFLDLLHWAGVAST